MNALDQATTIKEAREIFPIQYANIDSTFLEVYKEPIENLKAAFSEKGGVYIVSVGEYDMICRLPSTEHFKQVRKGSENRDAFEVDRELFSYCLLYPTIDQVNVWVSEGKPGIISSAVRTLMDLGLINQKAETKKL